MTRKTNISIENVQIIVFPICYSLSHCSCYKIKITTILFIYSSDIVPIQLNGQTQWNIDRSALLAMTDGVVKETIFQGFSSTMHLDGNLFFTRASGVGTIFVKSRCAIIQRHLKEGEKWIIKHGHLVAWNCPYSLEKLSDSLVRVLYTMEALVCKFTGPGTVFIHVNKE